MTEDNRESGGAATCVPDSETTRGEESPRPDTVGGWPVRWERRGRADDGHHTIRGMTAVVDGPRCSTVIVRFGGFGRPATEVEVGPAEVDGQPIEALTAIAYAIASDVGHATVST